MPRGRPRKNPESAAQQPANGNAGKGMSKMDAMRQALADLGKDAMPVQLKDHLKSKFGIDMPPAHVSNYKSVILKQAPKKGKPGRKPKAATPPSPAPAPVRQTSGGISLADIRAVKELAVRLGADKVRELADLFSK